MHETKLSIPKYCVVFSSLLALNDALSSPVDLRSALQSTRNENQIEWNEESKEIDRIQLEKSKINSAYDLKWANELTFSEDKEASQSKAYDKATATQFKTGLSKYFSSGTFAEFNLKFSDTELVFPQPGDPTSLGNGISIPAYDPSSNYSTNPEKKAVAQLVVRQPLWKNFGAKEVELQKKLVGQQSIQPKHSIEITKQHLQGQTEQLFWNLTALKEKIQLTKKLIDLQKSFVKEISALVAIGRSEQVDKATAQTALESRKGQLLQQELSAELIEHKIHSLLDPQLSSPLPKLKLPSLNKPVFSLPAAIQVKPLLDFALKYRLDLQMLEQLKSPFETQVELAKESYKPNLDLFASYSISGLGKDSADVSEDAKNHSTTSVGLIFSMPIFSHGYSSAVREPMLRSQKIDAQKTKTSSHIKKSITETLLQLRHGKALHSQALSQISILKKQEKIEQQRFLQARSDQAAILRYQIETQSAKMMSIDALLKQRVAEANLRLLTHAYPRTQSDKSSKGR